jgi:MFS family permease
MRRIGTRILTTLFGDYSSIMTPTLRRLFFGNFLSSLGTGMTLSLLLVYLETIRGFSTTFGGFLLSYMAVVSIIFSAPAGWLVDKIGPKKVIIVGLLCEGSAAALWSIVATKQEALIVATMSSLGTLMIWPPQTVMVTRVAPEAQRQRIYGFNFMLFNFGLGLGGFFAAIIVRENDPGSFELLYRLDSLSYFAYLFVIWKLKGNFDSDGTERKKESGSYRDVLADRTFMKIAFAGLICITFGYASLQGGIAIFMSKFLELSPKWIGIVYGANTIAIFLLQGLVLKIIEKRNKYRVLEWTGWIWAFSWLVVGAASLFTGLWAGVLVAASQVVFAVGEMIWSPTSPTVANELAPDELRGRYNAFMGAQWNVAGVIGPAIVGIMLGNNLSTQWLALMVMGSLLPILLFRSVAQSTIKS